MRNVAKASRTTKPRTAATKPAAPRVGVRMKNGDSHRTVTLSAEQMDAARAVVRAENARATRAFFAAGPDGLGSAGGVRNASLVAALPPRSGVAGGGVVLDAFSPVGADVTARLEDGAPGVFWHVQVMQEAPEVPGAFDRAEVALTVRVGYATVDDTRDTPRRTLVHTGSVQELHALFSAMTEAATRLRRAGFDV